MKMSSDVKEQHIQNYEWTEASEQSSYNTRVILITHQNMQLNQV